ncbi:hypothetical protein [Streptomyces sp. NBC_01408]|uniref:hypothetical protein n=1 Tax=Streptomyces sp. NBC_01408 TaxID=2903855 RepID=UPI0022527BF7|nr:hypothetical protein [Streptomyces sp. NBC_01408]MCX4695475.1 hypothetical protein [Streptomyces sp. NBC_01408]
MTNYQEDAVPATTEDLVSDARELGVAQASTRMIKDWVEHGLLAPPAFRKFTQRGSAARVFLPEQRRLFREIIEAKKRSPLTRVPHHTVVPVNLHIWLTYDTVITDEQALRGFRTYARSAGVSSAARRQAAARAIVDQFAHPEARKRQRRHVEALLIQGERTKQPRWDLLGPAMRDLASPWRDDGLPRLDERAIGLPEMPMTFDHAVALWMLKLEVTRRLQTESIPPEVLLAARAEFRRGWVNYQNDRAQLETRAEDSAAMFALPVGTEARVREHVHAFTTTLGRATGVAEPIFASVREGLRRR